jgi:hypothetical protein
VVSSDGDAAFEVDREGVQGGLPVKKFVRATRRYRTIEIQAGAHTITAADPLPNDLHDALHHIHRSPGAH